MSSFQSGDGNQDFELNIVPVIDCFTVLISYLLVSASFLSLASLDVGVSVSGEGAVTEDQLKDPPYSLTVKISEAKDLELRLIGGPEGLDQKFAMSADSKKHFDKKALQVKLTELKGKYPKLADISVSAEGPVFYREIIQVIESIKPTYPKVFLAGGNENKVRQ